MKLAIQETMLPGATTLERLRNARVLGLAGVEFPADGLTLRVTEVFDALQTTGLQAAAVNAGPTRLLHPDYDERDRAIAGVRQAMADALDLGAAGVVFTPHYSTRPVLPDLTPYKSAVELEAELLVKQLRATLTDLAYALGVELYMAVVSRQRAHLINRLEQAILVRRGTDDHPHLKLAASLCDLMMEEDEPVKLLAHYAAAVGYVQAADSGYCLPGEGGIDFAPLLAALRSRGYDGWLTLACASGSMDALSAAIEALRRAGA